MGRFVKNNPDYNPNIDLDDNDFDRDYDDFYDAKEEEKKQTDELSLDDLPNSDLSLSNYKINDDTPNPKKKAFLIILLVGAALLSLVAIGSVGYLLVNGRPPACKSVHIESDNLENQSTAKYGSMITLSFTFNKDIVGKPTVIIQDREVVVYGEGRKFYAKYFVQNPGPKDEAVKFTIKDYKDNFNRKGSPVTTTTDLSRVVILAVK